MRNRWALQALAIPSYLLLGYFDHASVGASRTPFLATVQHDHFDAAVTEFFGDLPTGDDCGQPVYRDHNGVVTVSNWRLLDRQNIAVLVIAFQNRTNCECVNVCRRDSRFVASQHLAQHFHYYNVEFKRTCDWWQEICEVLDEKRESGNSSR